MTRSRPRIVLPLAHRTVASFIERDLEILREEYDVQVVPSITPTEMLVAARAAARADALFCWFGSTRFLIPALAAKTAGCKVVIVAGGYDVANEGSIEYGNMRGGWSRALGRLLFALADRVFAFSESGAREAREHARAAASRVQVIYLGVAAQAARTEKRRKERLVACVGLLNDLSIKRKGVDTVVRSSRLLPDVQFVVAGSGDGAAVEALKREAGPNVSFPGFVSDAERDELFRRARIYAQPSVHEGFGYAVAEAMQFDCIPVVSERGSLPEVAGPFGRYVEPGDAKGLAEAIRRTLDQETSSDQSPSEWIARTFPIHRRREALLKAMKDLLCK